MRMVLESENRIQFEMAGDGFDIASDGPAMSPYHLLAGSLASCTALTLASWAQHARISIDPLTITVGWEVSEGRPKQVARMNMELRWPGLAADRIATAERVADLCPIHATLKPGTRISRRIAPS